MAVSEQQTHLPTAGIFNLLFVIHSRPARNGAKVVRGREENRGSAEPGKNPARNWCASETSALVSGARIKSRAPSMCTFISEFRTDATLYMHGEAARANAGDREGGNCAANAISARGVTPYADCILSNVISRHREAVSDSHGERAQARKRREKTRFARLLCDMFARHFCRRRNGDESSRRPGSPREI